MENELAEKIKRIDQEIENQDKYKFSLEELLDDLNKKISVSENIE